MTEKKYENKILAFLDILGFENLVNESKQDANIISKIVNMLEMISDLGESSKITKLNILEVDPTNYEFHQFSDSLVIIGDDISHDHFQYMSWLVMRCQYYLFKEAHYFLRGAMVVGDIYDNDNVMFGPALVNAYHIERDKDKAIWPRVLVDKGFYDKFNEDIKNRDFIEFLRKESGGIFLDYLTFIFHMIVISILKDYKNYLSTNNPEDLFSIHKEAILYQVNSIKKTGELNRKENLNKYKKLSHYHNQVIDRLIKPLDSDLSDIATVMDEFIQDQDNYRSLGDKYEVKYNAENYPEQSDVLDMLGTVLIRIIKNKPSDIFTKSGIIFLGKETEVIRAKRLIIRESPIEKKILKESLIKAKIDVDKDL